MRKVMSIEETRKGVGGNRGGEDKVEGRRMG